MKKGGYLAIPAVLALVIGMLALSAPAAAKGGAPPGGCGGP